MIPSKYAAGPSSAARKSRIEGRPSMLPKPRRQGSTDRLSTEARRPSTAGHRSSSLEAPRATIGGGRLSREASATKLSLNPRSKSQQYTPLKSMQLTTPLHSNIYSRATTTPMRTPSEDRFKRTWQTSLERALAFVTVKDQRPLSSAAWQRAEWQRISEALASRSSPSGCMTLIRPLTTARFVEITGALVQSITTDPVKLNTDNYLSKLPHFSKRLLYPGTVSKSWLRTVNTLHAFPHALAFIAYLLDLVNHIETPVAEEWLYPQSNDLALLRHSFLSKCWLRFQVSCTEFDDIDEEYLQNLKMLLGNDDEKIAELKQSIKRNEECLADEKEAAARAEEARLRARRQALAAALKGEQGARLGARAAAHEQRARSRDMLEALRLVDHEVERANDANERLSHELARQPLSVAERTRLLDQVDYSRRVTDSKRALHEQITKMVQNKEMDLALWQKKTLDSCVEYKQGLIHLSAEFPEVSAYAIDENELMGVACSEKVTLSVAALREKVSAMSKLKSLRASEKAAKRRQRARLVEESQAKIRELKSLVDTEQQTLEAEVSKENAAAVTWVEEKREIGKRIEALTLEQEKYDKSAAELSFWQQQDDAWQQKLSSMKTYIEHLKNEAKRELQIAKEKRSKLMMNNIKLWNEKLAH